MGDKKTGTKSHSSRVTTFAGRWSRVRCKPLQSDERKVCIQARPSGAPFKSHPSGVTVDEKGGRLLSDEQLNLDLCLRNAAYTSKSLSSVNFISKINKKRRICIRISVQKDSRVAACEAE